MTCTTCQTDVAPSNLYHCGEIRTCPTCMSRRHEEEQAKRHRAVEVVGPEHGLVVVDFPRAMAGRVIAMERRRRP